MSPLIIFLPFLLMSFSAHRMVFSQSVVENLPGFPGKIPFKLETGYIGVGESEEIQIFYYFVESEANPETDPLLFWLTGGPGCSGLSTIVYEIGPIKLDRADSGGGIPALVLNPYSWTKAANIIFVDQPVGTGFSYGKTPDAYNISDTNSATHSYEFLQKWLINHPKFLENPLYIGGDSYSGTIVPLLVDQVYNDIDAGSKPLLNMKGFILGNPVTDQFGDFNGRVDYAHRMGLLSDELYLSAKQNCHGNYLNPDPDNNSCKDALDRVNQCVDKVEAGHILDPYCSNLLLGNQGLLMHHTPSYEETARRFLQPFRLRAEPCMSRDLNRIHSYKWANSKLVQKALHVREGTVSKWSRCNFEMGYHHTTYTYDVNNTVPYHKKFAQKDCRALIYSGDHDMVVPHTATEEWIRSLKLPVLSGWRPWFVEGQVGGYTTTYINGSKYELTYATVKGAGHTAPEYKPLECYPMIKRWLSGDSL